MNRIKFFVLISAIIFSFSEIYAACCPAVKAPAIKGGSSSIKKNNNSRKLEISGKLRRLEEEASDLDRKLKRAKPDNSKRYINMSFERHKLSLDIIHECHRYLESYGDKKQDTRLQDIQELLKKESALLQKAMKDHKEFPYPESLADMDSFVTKIRKGDGQFNGRLPSGDTKLRSEIHQQQKKALDMIHKSMLGSRRN